MRRRRFIRNAALGAVGMGFAGRLQGCAPVSTDAEDFDAWTWVHGGQDRTEAEWAEHFARIREAGIQKVLVGGGDVELLSGVAHAQGMEFHRWEWILNRNGDAWAQENHPEWFTVSREGKSTLTDPPYVGYYRWVCPSRAPVRAYLAERMSEVAAQPGVDGVHLDYIRHSDVILPRGLWSTYDIVQDQEYPPYDFCYCDACRGQFMEEAGRDPLELEDPAADAQWVRFRWDSVTRLVTELAEAVHGHGKPISAAVFPTPTLARQLVRQAWDQWPVDMLFPMLYQGFYEEDIDWIGEGVMEGVAALGGTGVALRAGLYLPDLDPAQTREAIRVAREAGAAGVAFFEMNGLSDAHLEAVREALEAHRARAG